MKQRKFIYSSHAISRFQSRFAGLCIHEEESSLQLCSSSEIRFLAETKSYKRAKKRDFLSYRFLKSANNAYFVCKIEDSDDDSEDEFENLKVITIIRNSRQEELDFMLGYFLQKGNANENSVRQDEEYEIKAASGKAKEKDLGQLILDKMCDARELFNDFFSKDVLLPQGIPDYSLDSHKLKYIKIIDCLLESLNNLRKAELTKDKIINRNGNKADLIAFSDYIHQAHLNILAIGKKRIGRICKDNCLWVNYALCILSKIRELNEELASYYELNDQSINHIVQRISIINSSENKIFGCGISSYGLIIDKLISVERSRLGFVAGEKVTLTSLGDEIDRLNRVFAHNSMPSDLVVAIESITSFYNMIYNRMVELSLNEVLIKDLG